jgi:NADPH:quinone reductase-like Zn-dependent oxidoreductase
MKAQVLTAFGPDAPFELTELPAPVLRPGHVLIKVSATRVNPADYKARELGHVLDFVPPLPATLGMDVAGTVMEVGEGVGRFKVGDRVFGLVGGVSGLPGTLAEYVLADERLIAHAPASIPLAHAAALPLISITAWQAIRDPGVKAGDKVLVFGGSGNVGRMGIQLAKLQGALVAAIDHPGRAQTAQAA